MRRLTQAALVAAAAAALSQQAAFAASYATGVTTSGGNLNFTLNEDAQNVTVLIDGVPTSLGSKTAGAISVPLNGGSSWSIQVTQSSGLGFGTALPAFASGNTAANPLGGILQSQADTASARFGSVRGVDVNTYTSDLSLFGRVYVANSADAAALGTLATTGGPTLPARGATSKGIYVLDSRLTDVLGQGNTALTAGLTFDPTNAASPYRVTVGPDNSLYIADWSDNNGTVFRTDPNVTSGSNILAGLGSGPNNVPTSSLNHGSVAGVAVSGSLATGDLKLYTIDEDLKEATAADKTQMNSVWRYDVDSGPLPYAGTPTRLAAPKIVSASQTVDIARAPDGKLYVSLNRTDGSNGEAGITVVAPDGTKLWDSATMTAQLGLDADSTLAGTQDLLRRACGVTVSPDGKYMAVVRVDNAVWVLPIDQSTGLPDLSKRVLFNGFGTTANGRDIAFDAADNLYVASSGYAALRVFSPGGTSVTTLSSDGTFTSQNAVTPEWQNTGSGSTTTTANWPLGVVPSGSGSFVKFGPAIAANSTVTLGANTTYGSIIFDNPTSSYTIAGNTLTLNSPTYQTAPQIYVTSGNHTISSKLAISRSATLSVNTGSSLTLAGTLSGSGSLTVNGGNNTTGGSVEIATTGSIGTLTVRNNTVVKLTGASSTALKVTGISTSTTSGTPATTTYTGTFDITSGKVLVNYTGTTIADSIRAQIGNAYASGAWTGQGVSSSTAAADSRHIHALGYGEASDLLGLTGTATASWNGQSADATALLITYTYAGDANLNGVLDADDLSILDRGFAKYQAGTIAANAAHWTDGDFNYDGVVNSADFLIIDTTIGKLTGALDPALLSERESQFGADYVTALTAAVPEPTTLGLALAALPLAIRRRSRRA